MSDSPHVSADWLGEEPTPSPDGTDETHDPEPPAEQTVGTIPAPYWMAAGFEYGGFWIRLAAKWLDSLLLAAIAFVCAISLVGLLILPFVLLGYFPFFWTRGATPGQKICGLRVARASDGAPITAGMAAIRFVVELVETLAIMIGVCVAAFCIAAFDKRKRAWHDIAVGTIVIHAQLYELYDE
jgi:uncharacterized RDD family membrane protein YckC